MHLDYKEPTPGPAPFSFITNAVTSMQVHNIKVV